MSRKKDEFPLISLRSLSRLLKQLKNVPVAAVALPEISLCSMRHALCDFLSGGQTSLKMTPNAKELINLWMSLNSLRGNDSRLKHCVKKVGPFLTLPSVFDN